MKKTGKKSPACIQYVGLAGITEECKQAVMRFLQYRDQITLARILSSPANIHGSRRHGLLLTINNGDVVGVKAGFSSGYLGEGPRGFSSVLQFLKAHGVNVEEYEVDEAFIERLDVSALTRGDLDKIDAARPVRPTRWYEYLIDRDRNNEQGTLWQEFPPVIPLAIIDSRITDLALHFFERPDNSLLTGYRRLEDIVRKKTGIDQHGVKLFSEAFHGDKAKLGWKDLRDNECTGRANLFTGAYMAYRNPRAHREVGHHADRQLAEFLLLNHLFVLEKESTERVAQ